MFGKRNGMRARIFSSNLRIIIIILIPLVCSSCGLNEFDIEFGLLGQSDDGFFLREKTNEIPFLTREQGQIYGVNIKPVNEKSYEFYLILYLPGIPQKLGGDAVFSTASEQGRIIRSPVYKMSGVTAFPMWLDEGDPVGKYKAEIYANSKLVRTIEYEVVK